LVPNVELGAVELADDVKLSPKPLLPKPPNVEPEDNEGGAPNELPEELALELVAVVTGVVKLIPNGDVVAVLLPKILPVVTVFEADVVVGNALVNTEPNGLAGEVVEVPKIFAAGTVVVLLVLPKTLDAVVGVVILPKILVAGADVVRVPKGLVVGACVEMAMKGLAVGADVVVIVVPKMLVVEVDVVTPDGVVLGADVTAAELLLAGAPKNAFESDVVPEGTLPKSVVPAAGGGAVVVLPPNGIVEEGVDVKFNAVPPISGFEPNPVDMIGFVDGKVGWTRFESDETAGNELPKLDGVDDGAETAVVDATDVVDGLTKNEGLPGI
jgi:hypothetical protein